MRKWTYTIEVTEGGEDEQGAWLNVKENLTSSQGGDMEDYSSYELDKDEVTYQHGSGTYYYGKGWCAEGGLDFDASNLIKSLIKIDEKVNKFIDEEENEKEIEFQKIREEGSYLMLWTHYDEGDGDGDELLRFVEMFGMTEEDNPEWDGLCIHSRVYSGTVKFTAEELAKMIEDRFTDLSTELGGYSEYDNTAWTITTKTKTI